MKSTVRVKLDCRLKAENVLEVGEAVVAAESHVIAKEREHQREGKRLRDDREMHAAHTRAEREEAEEKSEDAGNEQHHEGGEDEPVEAVPIPGKFGPVEEDHEIGKVRIAIDTAAADLAHEVHANGIAPQRKKGAMAEAQYAAIAPDKIERQGEHGITKILADERHCVGGNVKRARRWHEQVQDRDRDQQARESR